MKRMMTSSMLLLLFSSTAWGQDAPASAAEPAVQAPTRIVLEEKQVSGGTMPVETKLVDGTRIRAEMGATASMVKYEMSDKRGDALKALKIVDGEVGVDCSPEKKLCVWVPDGEADLEGGEHLFVVVKDGWRQVCLSPRAMVEERRTGAKWSMVEQQKVRVERVQSCVLITHEKDSQESIYVSIPANWIVHTLKGEDRKSESERVFAGDALTGLRNCPIPSNSQEGARNGGHAPKTPAGGRGAWSQPIRSAAPASSFGP